MKISTFWVLASLLVLSPSALRADDAPASAPASPSAPADSKPALYQVSKLKGADVEIKEDAQAIGGEYVMNKQPYNPVLFMKTPPGAELTIWGYVRGSSFQLKAVIGDKQQELDWVWGTAGQFAWKKFGTYPREKLGDNFVIIRGDKAEANDGINCILVSPNPNYDPVADKDVAKLLAN
jgi:hypothetical protein